jgi:phosphoribosylformylglycinamidine synthase
VSASVVHPAGIGVRLGVVVFPGSNCDRDAGNAWAENGFGEVVYLWHDSTDLQGVDAVLLPGGFSYGDSLRAGAIARFAPILDAVARFADEGGPVIGICNGFQILCEAGLLPGALAKNDGLRFVCRTVHLRVETTESLFLSAYTKGDVLAMPIAHGEGRYLCEDTTYAQLIAEDRVAFRYVTETGEATEEANPNGARDNIAGIIGGKQRNILGMMPHPERAAATNLGSVDGRGVFTALQSVFMKKR